MEMRVRKESQSPRYETVIGLQSRMNNNRNTQKKVEDGREEEETLLYPSVSVSSV